MNLSLLQSLRSKIKIDLSDLPEIVVAARMMTKKETSTRVRVLENLSSLSEILRSAWGEMLMKYYELREERGERREPPCRAM